MEAFSELLERLAIDSGTRPLELVSHRRGHRSLWRDLRFDRTFLAGHEVSPRPHHCRSDGLAGHTRTEELGAVAGASRCGSEDLPSQRLRRGIPAAQPHPRAIAMVSR